MKTTIEEKQIPTVERLEKLGFAKAADLMTQQKECASPELKRQLRTAFEHFDVITPEHVQRFNGNLRKITQVRIDRRYVRYKVLKFVPIHKYPLVPPTYVLEALEKAGELKCFDYFEVGVLVDQRAHDPLPDPDPILVGRIKESDNYFFVAQWDNDVRIEDILTKDERMGVHENV